MNQATIYVVRHGQSTANLKEVAAGQSDPALTEEGRRQAAATKVALGGIRFDKIYSSDLQRASETAAIISGRTVPKGHQLPALRERDFGELEGKPMAAMHQAHDRILGMSADKQRHARYAPGAESDHEVAGRFLGALRDIGQNNPGKTLLVVAHGGTLRVLLVELGYATMAEVPPGAFGNAGFVELVCRDGQLSIKRTVGVTRQPRAGV